MDESEPVSLTPELERKAQRAQRILYWTMGILILLPFVLVWITGAIRVE